MTLVDLLESQHDTFDALAAAWIASGAQSFSVWAHGALLEYWPRGGFDPFAQAGTALVCPVQLHDQVVGELRVEAEPATGVLPRLQADARMIASLLPLRRDLFHVTSELIETRDQLLAMYALSHSCSACDSLEDLLDTLAEQINEIAQAENTFLLFTEENGSLRKTQQPSQHYEEAELLDLQKALGKHEYLIVSYGSDEILLNALFLQGARGVLGLVNKRSGAFFSPDVKLASAIAAQASQQIENVLLVESKIQLARIQTEMNLARQVQNSLMPKDPPRLPGLEIWAATHPALDVGGDFFDFILKPGTAPLLVAGDLSGKGFSAALLMSMTRTVIRTAIQSASTPEQILTDTNNDLYDDFNALSSFATLFVGQYFAERGELVYANAGHSPVIYLPLGGQPRLLVADGIPLGILPYSNSRDQCLPMKPGDLLLVGTDGLTDAASADGQRFGYERLIQLITELSLRPLAEMAHAIFGEVAQFSTAALPTDDQTLMIIRKL